MLATLEIALRTLVESSVIAVITASVITASTTPYSAIVWPSSRLRSSAAAAVYACAKAKSFNKGFTSPRAFSGACLLNGWFEGGAATTPDSSYVWRGRAALVAVLGLIIGLTAAGAIPRGSD